MTQTQQVLEKAVGLPPIERAELVEGILSSFDFPSRADIDAAWAQEAEDRIDLQVLSVSSGQDAHKGQEGSPSCPFSLPAAAPDEPRSGTPAVPFRVILFCAILEPFGKRKTCRRSSSRISQNGMVRSRPSPFPSPS